MVKNLPVMQEMKETLVQAVDWEDSLDEEMATHSSILAWKIPWTEEPVGLSSLGLQSWTRLSNFTHFVLRQVVFLGGSVVKNTLQSMQETQETLV